MSDISKKMPYSGFTLIELMIVVAIVAILTAIALPSYKSYIVKTRRADVQAELTKWAQSLERYYTTNQKYNSSGTTCGAAAPSGTPSNNTYTFTTSACNANDFQLTASPATGTSQAGDGNQGLSNTGAHTGTWAK